MTVFAIIFNLAVCSVQVYITWMLIYVLVTRQPLPTGGIYFHRPRLAICSMILVSLLEFATTLYDLDGPGTHFPLGIRIPVLAFQTAVMLRAL